MTISRIGGVATIVLASCPAVRNTDAQVVKAQILGTATDQTGAVVPGARITITETNTNFGRSTLTNESGNYFFVNLDPGVFRVEAQHTGFSKAVRNEIDLQPTPRCG